MQYVLQVFETEDHHDFRTIDRDGEPWCVLADVCRSLEIGNPSDAAKRLDDDEKGVVSIDTLGGRQTVIIINESGLYSLILTSRKESAKRFKKWVTAEVLPTIRKTGSYKPQRQIPAFIRRMNENWDRVSPGYFSVINELAQRLYGRLELVGYVMADKAPDGTENRPDVSVGLRFPPHLNRHYPHLVDKVRYYIHRTPEWEGYAKQYPNEMLSVFIDFVDTVWLIEHAADYLKKRDPAALPYLQKLLPANDRPSPLMKPPKMQPKKRVG